MELNVQCLETPTSRVSFYSTFLFSMTVLFDKNNLVWFGKNKFKLINSAANQVGPQSVRILFLLLLVYFTACSSNSLLFIFSVIESKILSILKLLELVFIRLFFSVRHSWLAWFDKNNLKLVNSAVKQVGPQSVKILMFLF